MEDLTLAKVIHLCRELGDVLGHAIALAPLPNSHLYQIMSVVCPNTGNPLLEWHSILGAPRQLSDIDEYLRRAIKLGKSRVVAIDAVARSVEV